MLLASRTNWGFGLVLNALQKGLGLVQGVGLASHTKRGLELGLTALQKGLWLVQGVGLASSTKSFYLSPSSPRKCHPAVTPTGLSTSRIWRVGQIQTTSQDVSLVLSELVR